MEHKELDWRIWSKNDLVEERTYLRAQKITRNGICKTIKKNNKQNFRK